MNPTGIAISLPIVRILSKFWFLNFNNPYHKRNTPMKIQVDFWNTYKGEIGIRKESKIIMKPPKTIKAKAKLKVIMKAEKKTLPKLVCSELLKKERAIDKKIASIISNII